MFEYFSAAIAAARKDPGDDLLGALVCAEIDGERLSDWDILGFCFVVVAGGADTTASLISHTVLLTGEDMDAARAPARRPDAGARGSGGVPAPRVLRSRGWRARRSRTSRSMGSRSRRARRC